MRAMNVSVVGGERPARPVRLVGEVMSTPVETVDASAGLGRVLSRFTVTGLRHLAVLSTRGACLGVLSDRVVRAAWSAERPGTSRLRAGDIVVADHPAAHLEDTVASAARTMLEHGVDALPVLGPEGRVLGVVTGSDLARLLVSVLEDPELPMAPLR